MKLDVLSLIGDLLGPAVIVFIITYLIVRSVFDELQVRRSVMTWSTILATLIFSIIWISVVGWGEGRNGPWLEGEGLSAPKPEPKAEVKASRLFAGPDQYPPEEFAAYGIMAFPSRASPYTHDRYVMICNAYVASLPHAAELHVPRVEQMATVWPVREDAVADVLNHSRQPDICETAVLDYGLVLAKRALLEAMAAGVEATGSGPFLLAWSPSSDKGKEDALVLVSDLSDVTTYAQAESILLAWSKDIESDPTLWKNGWNVERLRLKIRHWVDNYGSRTLAIFGLKNE